MPRLIAAVATLLLMSGCTAVDQNVALSPEAPRAANSIAAAEPVALDVVDARTDNALGHINNLDAEPARITTTQDLAAIVKTATAETLQWYGFRPVAWRDRADPRMLVEIERIDHQVDATLPRDASTEVELRVRAWRGNETYTARAQSSLSKRMVGAATPEANAELIDQALTQALERLLSPELARFLAGIPTRP